uniref:PiggyBac transposable element-derived protein domain-containing protein n=1 Tax=Phytophthora ramorum TaxID=164328 RepID=H3GW33_PHYRM
MAKVTEVIDAVAKDAVEAAQDAASAETESVSLVSEGETFSTLRHASAAGKRVGGKDAAGKLPVTATELNMESDKITRTSQIDTNPPVSTTPMASSGRVLRPRVQVKRDVNFVADNERSSSGKSDGCDVVDEDEYESPDRNGANSDEEVLSDGNTVQLNTAFTEVLQIGNDAQDKKAKMARENTLHAMQWTPAVSTFESDSSAYDALESFFFFMLKPLWVLIDVETNRYSLEQVERRAMAMQAKQTASRRETLVQTHRRLKAKPRYQTHGILHVIGLLVAQMLCSQKRRFSAHWSMAEDGVLPAGNFGRFMSRNRCQDILRDFHVVDNEAPSSRDKLWKLRPVATKLQQQFLAGWSLPAVFSFDGSVLLSTSLRNTTRMFKYKPHH